MFNMAQVSTYVRTELYEFLSDLAYARNTSIAQLLREGLKMRLEAEGFNDEAQLLQTPRRERKFRRLQFKPLEQIRSELKTLLKLHEEERDLEDKKLKAFLKPHEEKGELDDGNPNRSDG